MALLEGVDFAGSMALTLTIVKWGGLLILLAIAAMIVMFIALYKYNVLIYDNGIWKKDKARKVKKGMISTFELKSSMMQPKQNKEVFMIPHNLIQKTPKGSIIMIEKLADGIYYPISKEQGEIELKITPQKLNWLLERTRKIVDKYSDKKWYEQAWFGVSMIMAVAVIEFIAIIIVMDRVEGFSGSVSGACTEAQNKILDVTRQQITP